jgi:CRISPR-associated protein Cas1
MELGEKRELRKGYTVRKSKTAKIVLDTYGNYLGMGRGCLVLKNEKGVEEGRYPLAEMELGEVVLTSGNLISTSVLTTLAFWQIDTLLTTKEGKPIGCIKSLADDRNVATVIGQVEALKNGKGIYLAKQFSLAKMKGQSVLLKRYRMNHLKDYFGREDEILRYVAKYNDIKALRARLMSAESRFAEMYFVNILNLLPEDLRPPHRKTYKCFDAVNNTFNLAYTLLLWKSYRALVKASLEPHIGYLHAPRLVRPNLACDFMELYRHLVDDYVIRYLQKVTLKDLQTKEEVYNGRKIKRMYLKKEITRDFSNNLHKYFRKKVRVARIRRGNVQEIESLMNEEAFLLAGFLRNERDSWNPRIASL